MIVTESVQDLKFFTSQPETRGFEENKKVFDLLNPILVSNPIFQQDSNLIKACCKRMAFEEFLPQQTVFQLGNRSDKFYIVLTGSLTAYVPLNPSDTSDLKFVEVKKFLPGDYFGELGLLKTQSRSATVKADTTSLLASLSKADYKKTLSAYTESKINKSLEFLQKIPIFACIPVADLVRLTYFFTSHMLTKNQILFKEHSKAEKLFIIQQGDFKLTKSSKFNFLYHSAKALNHNWTGNHAQRNTELQIGIKSDNEILGAEELFERSLEYKHSCVCVSNEATVLGISEADFRIRVKQKESWKRLSELVTVKKADYEVRVRNLSEVERYKNQFSRDRGCIKSESFMIRSGILRKISPAREMSKSNFVLVEKKREERKLDGLKKKFLPLFINYGMLNSFSKNITKKLVSK